MSREELAIFVIFIYSFIMSPVMINLLIKKIVAVFYMKAFNIFYFLDIDNFRSSFECKSGKIIIFPYDEHPFDKRFIRFHFTYFGYENDMKTEDIGVKLI